MLTKDLAICIRAVDYSETSQVVTFFARASGKVSAIAKGSKRPKSAFDGAIEILSFGEIVFSNSSREKLATLTEFQQRPGFTSLAGDLLTLNCGLFAGELVSQLTNDYDPHPQLFDSFLQFLKDMRETGHEKRETLSLLILFQLALLREIGLLPIFSYCANCKTRYEHRVYFSSSANGLVCRDCESSFPDRIRLTAEATACLADPKRIAAAQEKTLSEVEEVLIAHFTELLGHKPKMAKHILAT